MKLVIQIPCYNEEKTLPVTLKELPERIEGIDKIEIMVVDDGSSDNTIKVAKDNGVDHVLRLPSHQGLAKAFYAGLQRALELGADIIVNTDADNQYDAAGIKDLTRPIIEGKADITVGARDFCHMPKFKVFLERTGSFIVSKMAGVTIKDAVSGFRAYSKKAALRIFIYTDYTYTLETLVQAARKNLVIRNVDIKTNEKIRESRLVRSLSKYMRITFLTFVNVLFLYQPLKFFFLGGGVMVAAGMALGVRFLYFYFTAGGAGRVQSLIFMAILVIVGFLVWMLGIIAHLIANNRRLIEDNMAREKEIALFMKTRRWI
jgi:glycosyltransferase involved in cell wall biosynthesis